MDNEPAPGTPGFVALTTGQLLWAFEQSKDAINRWLTSPSAQPIVWVVEDVIDYEGTLAIGWCSSEQLAREFAAQFWRGMRDIDQVRIYPARMNVSNFGGPGSPSTHAPGWGFDGTAAAARDEGWLDADGNPVTDWTPPPACEHCAAPLPEDAGECPCRERARLRSRNAAEINAALRELAAQPPGPSTGHTRHCDTDGCGYAVHAATQEAVDAEYAKHLATDPRHTGSEWTDRDGRERKGLD